MLTDDGVVTDLLFKYHAADLPYLCDFCYNEVCTNGLLDQNGNELRNICECEDDFLDMLEDMGWICCDCFDEHAEEIQRSSGIDADRRSGYDGPLI